MEQPGQKKSPKSKAAKDGSNFGRKKLGYRTPDRFKRLVFRKNPAIFSRPRSLGGHQ